LKILYLSNAHKVEFGNSDFAHCTLNGFNLFHCDAPVEPSNEPGPNIGAIAGGVIGGIATVAVITGVIRAH